MAETLPVIREMKAGEEQAVCDLVRKVFSEFVAPQYSDEGVVEFLSYADARSMARRVQSDHTVLLAEIDGELVGVIETRNFRHISLLFVSREYQRRGIARRLIMKALKIARIANPGLSSLTVKSSPNAVGAYEALGFKGEGPEIQESGIRFLPMRMAISSLNTD